MGWLRFRLWALTGEGGPLAERDGRFLPAEDAAPKPPAPWMVDDAPPRTDGDAVMRAVRDVLVEHGRMRPADIVGKLPPAAVKLAEGFWKDGLDNFANKMAKRVGSKTYFHPLGEGLYGAGPGEAEVA